MRLIQWIGTGSMLLVLAACGGQTPSDVTTNNGTPVIVENPTTAAFVIVTLSGAEATEDMMADIPGFGTLEASATEDPNIDLTFSQIDLYVYGGGEAANPITLSLLEDGSFTRNDTSGTITPERVTAIDDLLDEINFFGLQVNYIGFAASTNLKYRLIVRRGTQERTIDSEDGYMPTQYTILLGELINVGVVP